MIINASGGNADAVMTVAQTLSDTQKTQARMNIGALSSANGAVAAKNLASNAVETAKIKDANVTRAKLANDALYSPITWLNSTTTAYTIAVADVGKTLILNGGATAQTITVPTSTNYPNGYEIAIFSQGSGAGVRKIVFSTGSNVLMYGESKLTAPTLQLVNSAMVALKKIASDLWIVTGPAEVV